MRSAKLLLLVFCFCLILELPAAPLVVGIAGGTGSGKSTLADRLAEALGDRAVVLRADAYYLHRPDLSLEERTQVNYDHPDSIEFDLFKTHLEKLKRGETIEVPQYDFGTHLRRDETQSLHSAPVILAEGILLFAEEKLADMFDLRIFVDTEADVGIIRRLERDVASRGRTVSSVQSQYLKTVKPMHERYVEPSKWSADLIIPTGRDNQRVIDLLLQYLG
jgi:uridine kinase